MKKMKRFFAVFIATIMILGNLPAYAATIGAGAKADYLKTEKRFLNEVSKSLEKSELGKLVSFTEKIDKAYTSEIDVEVKVPDIKTRKYIIKENGTYLERYEDGVVEAYVEGEKVATLNVLANDNYVSLQVPELYEKYLTADMNDLAGVFKKFDESIDTSKLPTGIFYNSDVKEALKLTKAEEKLLNNAGKKYTKLFNSELLKNEYFEKDTKQNIYVNNSNYKCDVVSYKISTKELIDGLEVIWKEFKKDTSLVNLIWGKVEAIYNLSAKISPESETLPTKEQVMGAVDTLIAEAKKVANDEIDLVSTLYHQNGKLLKRDVGVAIGDEAVLASIYTINNSKGGYYAFYLDDFKVEDVVTKTSKDATHNITITSMSKDYDYVDGEFVVNEVEEIDKFLVKVTKVNNNQYNIEFLAEDSDTKVVMEYINNKVTSKVYDISMNFDIINEDQIIEVNTRIAYEKDIKLNKKNIKNNEINLNEKSKDELIELFNENKDEIVEKFTGKFGSAFYYDEIMESTKKTYERIEARADKATAAQIGKAIKIWLVDCKMDAVANYEVNGAEKLSADAWVKVSDLYNIESYVYLPYREDGYEYYVALTAEESDLNSKIIVGISENGYDLPIPRFVTETSDEVEGARVLYVEL